MPDLTSMATNAARSFQKSQQKKVEMLGLQNVISGKTMTAADVTKFTTNPYTKLGVNKLASTKAISNLRNKISNSKALAVMSKMGLGSLLDFGGTEGNATERIWSIVDESGEQAVAFNVYLSMTVKNEAKVVSMPVENGSFVTYNKCRSPIQITTSLAITGSPSDIKSALTSIMDMVDNTSIVSLITPDYEYKSLAFAGCNYRRSAEDGVDMLIVDCNLTEVREVELEYTNAKVAKKKSRGVQQSKPKSMLSHFFG